LIILTIIYYGSINSFIIAAKNVVLSYIFYIFRINYQVLKNIHELMHHKFTKYRVDFNTTIIVIFREKLYLNIFKDVNYIYIHVFKQFLIMINPYITIN